MAVKGTVLKRRGQAGNAGGRKTGRSHWTSRTGTTWEPNPPAAAGRPSAEVRESHFMGGGIGFLIGLAGQIISSGRARFMPTQDQKRATPSCSQILSHEVSKCKWRGVSMK
jgi:hypothetical protein